jgi:hypothetical protein
VADKLLPSESYFLFNDSSSPVQVVIFPISAETTSSAPITKSAKGAPGKAGPSAKYQPLPPALGAVGSEPYADVKTDRSRYFGGDSLVISMNFYNPGPDTEVDVYLWLNDSRGNLYTYDLRERRFVEGGQPTMASFPLPGGEALTDYVMVRHLLIKENTLVEGRSIPGNYTVSVSLTKPGSAQPIGDLIDSAAFTVVDGKR